MCSRLEGWTKGLGWWRLGRTGGRACECMERGVECCFFRAGEKVWARDASVGRLMVSVPPMSFVDISVFVIVVVVF